MSKQSLKCLLILVCFISASATADIKSIYHFIEGNLPEDRQPDGNSIVFEDDKQLVVFDTGRHPEHTNKILDYAEATGKPITTIINSHWHLDHSTGNARIRSIFPTADLYASDAVNEALNGFLIRNKERNRALLDDPSVSELRKTDIRLYLNAITDPNNLIPNKPVMHTTLLTMQNRTLELHLAQNAATKGDVWVYDATHHSVFVGDLVVAPVPFFDTACAEGWLKALNTIADTPFKTLMPGHGKPMSRQAFNNYHHGFKQLISCAQSEQATSACTEGWLRDAKSFIENPEQAKEYIDYYVDNIIRSNEKQNEFCGAK